jgi:hypothetical protein
MLTRRLSLNRVLPIAALAAVLAIAVAVTPSFAGSFLSSQKAARIYVKKKAANNTYLTQKSANNAFLKQKAAKNTYVAKKDLPDGPVAAVSASTVDFGPVSSTTAVDVPTSATTFTMPDTGLVTLTLSGQATCEAGTNGLGCPVQILIDGQAAGTGKVNFDTAGSDLPTAKAAVHSFTQTSVVTAGDHTASVQYAGATDPSIAFTLTDWNLVVQGFPGQ